MVNERILKRAKELEEEIRINRRQLHKNPEVGMDLPCTKAFVMGKLKEMGYEPKECGKSGVVAILKGKKEGKCFLLRADMDALPIEEETDVDYKSENKGKMHACGHDTHAAMLLGAAKILKEMEEEINGTVKLMFQPGEEIFEGAKDMIEAGVLENPKVDGAMMIHGTTGLPMPKGLAIVLDNGCMMASSDQFTITVKGKGGHGARPQDTIDSITIASHIQIALAEINSREIVPGKVGIVTTGTFIAGLAANVIPDTAVLKGTIRTGDEEVENYIKKRIEEIAKSIATAFRGEADVRFTNYCPPMIPNVELTNKAMEYIKDIFGKGVIQMSKVSPDCKVQSGSEDFAFVSSKVPAISMMLSMGGVENEYMYPQHHPKAKFDDDVLYLGAAAYAYVAVSMLEE